MLGQNIEFTQSEKEWIKDHPTIKFGYEPNWEPYEIYRNGEYTGIVGDYVKIIEEKTGIDLIPIPDITWAESIQKLKSGEINFVPCCAITEERKKYLDFTDVYIQDPMVIATRNNYEYISCIEDLYGKTITLPESYYTLELISKDHPQINILVRENVQACLNEVSYGNADAFVGNLGVITYNINNRGYNNIKIAAPTNYKDNGIALAVTKDWTIFRDIAQKVFDSVNQKDKSELKNNWISVKYEYGIAVTTVIKWIGSIILIFSIILLVFYLWNKSLKKQINLRIQSEDKLKEALSEINKQNLEKQTLLQEIHHRVKNNLQIITSLIRLQANTCENNDVKLSLNVATERIRTISLIHEKMYQATDFSTINIKEYATTLSKEIIRSLNQENINLNIESELEHINLKSIVPLALILNELITNSLKYAFKDQNSPQISIKFKKAKNAFKMNYIDNGTWTENLDSDQFGTSLINIFTEQLEGEFKLIKTYNSTEYQFNFKFID